MKEYKWAPIVYSATYYVDYRLIVIPSEFNEDDRNKQWLEKYITATTSVPERIREIQRWSTFRNDRFCAVGVTCLLQDLVKRSDDKPLIEKTQDVYQREIYGFWGYVTQIKRESLVELPQMNLELFQDLCTYVEEQWLVKNYNKKTVISEYTKDFLEKDIVDVNRVHDLERIKLNNQEQQVNLWAVNQNEALWLEFTKCNYSASLCLNLSREIDAIDSDFTNATTLDTGDFCKREKSKPPAIKIKGNDSETLSVIPEKTTKTTKQYLDNSEISPEFYGTFQEWGECDIELNKSMKKPSSEKSRNFLEHPKEMVRGEFQQLKKMAEDIRQGAEDIRQGAEDIKQGAEEIIQGGVSYILDNILPTGNIDSDQPSQCKEKTQENTELIGLTVKKIERKSEDKTSPIKEEGKSKDKEDWF